MSWGLWRLYSVIASTLILCTSDSSIYTCVFVCALLAILLFEHYRSRYPFMDLIFFSIFLFCTMFCSIVFSFVLSRFLSLFYRVFLLLSLSNLRLWLRCRCYHNIFIFNSILFFYIERTIIEPWNVRRKAIKNNEKTSRIEQCMRTISNE